MSKKPIYNATHRLFDTDPQSARERRIGKGGKIEPTDKDARFLHEIDDLPPEMTPELLNLVERVPARCSAVDGLIHHGVYR